MMETFFYLLSGIVLWTYFGYPLVILIRAAVWKRPYRSESITPKVSMIIACYNEEEGIQAKLENILSLDYPEEQLEVIIVSDGSTDQTEEIVRQYCNNQVQLICLLRGGKAPALNAAVATARGEVLIFSDANSMYRADAIQNIVRPFADLDVGGVAGNQVYRSAQQSGIAADGEKSYWDFDRMLKVAQSCSGNAISATGAIYAIRRCLFREVPDGVTDDFVTSTQIIAQKKRLVFEPKAICYEPVAGAVKAEFGRKTRVITRGLRGVIVMRELLNPFQHGFYSLQLFSHKVLRRLVVFPLVALALITPFLWNNGWWFQVATLLQVALYCAAIAGLLMSKTNLKSPKCFSVPFYFCMVNTAVIVAVVNTLRNKRIALWNPERPNTPSITTTNPCHSQCDTHQFESYKECKEELEEVRK
ncbi:hypothetical protein MNBD_PLANCTO02-1032 [hydrothermal vent metagenome]|uniref:Glycosyltransferase 2-like domain-containing protein n=1 Tax=hydrothermal vent metagenome TaxID=652676 RepID=A0A3B1DQP5_9ZZZZ